MSAVLKKNIQFYHQTVESLKKVFPERAEWEAGQLLREATGRSLLDLIAADRALSGRVRDKIRSWVRLRQEGRPFEHIVGGATFMDLGLKINPSTFIPRPETGIIVEEAHRWIAGKKAQPLLEIFDCRV